jgi:hypothetical protein
MGNLIAGKTDPNLILDDDIKNVKELLLKLKELDQNNDGIITKSEFTTWQKDQKNRMVELEEKITKQMENKYSTIIAEKDAQITALQTKVDDLTKQLGSSKNMNNILEAKFLHESSKDPAEQKYIRKLSKNKINEFVTELLSDHSVNINYLPDFVEKQIYKNVFNLLIGLLNKSLSTTSIKFLGHTLTFAITPDTDMEEVETNPEPNPKKKKREINIEITEDIEVSAEH